MVKTSATEKTTTPEMASKEEMELTAYFHWLDRGCPEGDSITDWIEAEKKLVAGTLPEKKK